MNLVSLVSLLAAPYGPNRSFATIRPYTQNLTWGEIVNLCRLTLPAEAPAPVKPNCNVAPTQQLPIVRPHGKVREGVIAGWGLVPFWMMDLKHGAFSTINARCETEYLDCWKGADLSEPR